MMNEFVQWMNDKFHFYQKTSSLICITKCDNWWRIFLKGKSNLKKGITKGLRKYHLLFIRERALRTSFSHLQNGSPLYSSGDSCSCEGFFFSTGRWGLEEFSRPQFFALLIHFSYNGRFWNFIHKGDAYFIFIFLDLSLLQVEFHTKEHYRVFHL